MPDMGGKELNDELEKMGLKIKTLFISGYTDDAITRSGILLDGITLLQKPFQPNNLLKQVRKLLDS